MDDRQPSPGLPSGTDIPEHGDHGHHTTDAPDGALNHPAATDDFTPWPHPRPASNGPATGQNKTSHPPRTT
jgi:hypothetical protein